MTTTLPDWLDSLAPATSPNDLALHRLGELGLLKVSGTDAEPFLQNMLSNDVRELDAEHAHLTSQCTPKGRIQALLLAFRRHDGLFLALPRNNLAATLKRLKLFVLRSQVSIDVADDSILTAVGISGQDAKACTTELLGGAAPDGDWQTRTHDEVTAIKLPGTPTRLMLVAPPQALGNRLATLSTTFYRAPDDAWQLADIEAGLPCVEDVTREHFVPQWINLDQLGGVSFKKGCYPGQEVVARLHYLGKPNRRMLKGRAALTEPPAAGSPIEREDGEQIGEIVRAARHPDGDIIFLAVVHTGKLDRPARLQQQPVWLDTHSLPETGRAGESDTVAH